nr:hypothetical protein [Brevundimonas nasdae]
MQGRVHLAALGARRQHHLFDQAAKSRSRLLAFGRLVQSLSQTRDLLAIGLGNAGVECDRRRVRVRLLGAKDRNTVLQFIQARHQRRRAPTVLDGVENSGDGALRLGQFYLARRARRLALVVEPVRFGDERADGFCRRFWGHQLVTKPVKDALLDLGAGDGAAVAAGVGVQMIGAGEAALASQGVGTVAAAAAQQA